MSLASTPEAKEIRRGYLENTITRTVDLIKEYEDADSSIFINQQIHSWDRSGKDRRPNYSTNVQRTFVNSQDTLECAQNLLNRNPSWASKIMVMNCCSPDFPGNRIQTYLGTTQEDCLNYSSTLLHTLTKQSQKYPFANHLIKEPGSNAQVGGIYSPATVVFKKSLERNCQDLEQPFYVSVMSVAAPKNPKIMNNQLDDQTKVYEMKERLRLFFRVAAQKRKTILILGALGCGIYSWPSSAVAGYMKDLIADPEFVGFFERIEIAIHRSDNVHRSYKSIFNPEQSQ